MLLEIPILKNKKKAVKLFCFYNILLTTIHDKYV